MATVVEQVGRPAPSGALFVFFGKRKSALKILFFDGSGLCLFYKRLDHHTFRVPSTPVPGATRVELNERELDELLDANSIDVEPTPRKGRRPALQYLTQGLSALDSICMLETSPVQRP